MNKKDRNKTNTTTCVVKFTKVNVGVLTPPAVALATDIETLLGEINDNDSRQVTGVGERQAGVAQRRLIAKKLREAMVDIGKMGRIIDQTTNPGLAEHLRLPKNPSYRTLLSTGDSFVEVVTPAPVKTALISNGLPATFLEDLSAILASFRAATERKYGGLLEQVQSRQGITTKVREAIRKVRALDAILSPQLRASDPTLYTAWKTAIHIARDPKPKKKKAATPVTSNQTGGAVISTPPATAPAPTVTP